MTDQRTPPRSRSRVGRKVTVKTDRSGTYSGVVIATHGKLMLQRYTGDPKCPTVRHTAPGVTIEIIHLGGRATVFTLHAHDDQVSPTWQRGPRNPLHRRNQ